MSQKKNAFQVKPEGNDLHRKIRCLARKLKNDKYFFFTYKIDDFIAFITTQS